MNPGALRESGWLELVGGCIQASGQATCHNNEYDYFVIDARLQHAVIGVAIVVDSGVSPHSPVRLWMRGHPRRHKVRVLVAPTRTNPMPPAGCLPADAHMHWEQVVDVTKPHDFNRQNLNWAQILGTNPNLA